MCPVIAAIAALILARTSSKEIAAAQDRLSGAGLNTATRIVAWLNIGVSILAGLAIALLVAFGVIFTATVASDMDPAMNARTGLADGTYVIDPSTRVNFNSECSYGGPAFASDGAEFPYTAVYGKGPIQCPDLTQVATVEIEVDGGVARIVNVR
jgi:hypothetical protein